jgi:uroporphyrinogen III methyltransferase / synthase
VSGTERRPLSGKRIVVTRPRAQAEAFATGLESLGAEVLAAPMIRIVEPDDPEPLRSAARAPGAFDWIVFTSANGVQRFWAALREAGLDTRSLAGVSLGAIGPATAAAVEREGASPDLVAGEAVAESVIDALAARGDLKGARVLLARAEVARDVLPSEIRKLGADVVDVPAYRTVPDTRAAEWIRAELLAGRVDLVTFTSSSTARHFADSVARDLGAAQVASIGPITSATLREIGWRVDVEASVHTTAGLQEAIVDHYSPGPGWR